MGNQHQRQSLPSTVRPSQEKVKDSLLQLLMDGERMAHFPIRDDSATVDLKTQAPSVRDSDMLEEPAPLGNYDCGRSLQDILEEAIHLMEDIEAPGEYCSFEQ